MAPSTLDLMTATSMSTCNKSIKRGSGGGATSRNCRQHMMIEGTVGAKYRVEFKDKLDDAAKWIVGDVNTLPERLYLRIDRFKPVRKTRY